MKFHLYYILLLASARNDTLKSYGGGGEQIWNSFPSELSIQQKEGGNLLCQRLNLIIRFNSQVENWTSDTTEVSNPVWFKKPMSQILLLCRATWIWSNFKFWFVESQTDFWPYEKRKQESNLPLKK